MSLPPYDELVNVLEMEDVARRALSRTVYERIAGGAGAGLTLRRNREAFDRMTFRPRVLFDVSQIDLSTELFGQKLYSPILVAPMARHRRAHPDGELATVQGAGAAKTVLIVSRDASYPIDQIAARASAPLWRQIYPEADPGGLREQLRQSAAAGCKVVCLTVRPDLQWDLFRRLREWATVPILLKGILSPGEAVSAVENGAQGLIVSNHGGRLVDGLPATIEALPKVVEAVKGRVPVLVDSGFRRGTDMLKALALGAKAVLIGRPILYGLGAYGADGVRAVLEMLQFELALAMGLCGKANLAGVDRTLVKLHRR